MTTSPFFIVGAPRSGTTMLSVLLDRHSRITIPPESNYFSEYLVEYGEGLSQLPLVQQIEQLLNFHRIADFHLLAEELRAELPAQPPLPPDALFTALLAAWRRKSGKSRVGEKSPKHIYHIDEIRQSYPQAKIICIVRDGRDVVRSLMKMPWAEPDNPRRFWLFCNEWNRCVRALERQRDEEHGGAIHLVHYEKLLIDPQTELRRICTFLGEEFEPAQLDTTDTSSTVPEWEKEWKGKAQAQLDPARIHAWKSQASAEEIRRMNFMMGHNLRRMDYADTAVTGCSFTERLALSAIRCSFHPLVQPFVLQLLKLTRRFLKQ